MLTCHNMLMLIFVSIIIMNKADESTNNFFQSDERESLEAPKNFTIFSILSATSALLMWKDASPDFVHGHSYYYKIQTWVENEKENLKEILIEANSTKALVNTFTPNSINLARIMLIKDEYIGPSSNIIQFKTPEGVPSPVQSVAVFPLGSNLMVQWKRPIFTNGMLQGYKIYYEQIVGNTLKPQLENQLFLSSNATQAKLAGLMPNTTYRIHIFGFTKQGNGEDYYTEQTTQLPSSYIPTPPTFTIKFTTSNSGYVTAKVTWHPNFSGTPGSHFYVQYRKIGEKIPYLRTDFELFEDFIKIGGLDPNEQYEFVVVSVEGNNETPSEPKLFKTNVD